MDPDSNEHEFTARPMLAKGAQRVENRISLIFNHIRTTIKFCVVHICLIEAKKKDRMREIP